MSNSLNNDFFSALRTTYNCAAKALDMNEVAYAKGHSKGVKENAAALSALCHALNSLRLVHAQMERLAGENKLNKNAAALTTEFVALSKEAIVIFVKEGEGEQADISIDKVHRLTHIANTLVKYATAAERRKRLLINCGISVTLVAAAAGAAYYIKHRKDAPETETTAS